MIGNKSSCMMECNDTYTRTMFCSLQSRVCKEIYNLPTFLQYRDPGLEGQKEDKGARGYRGPPLSPPASSSWIRR